MPTITLNWNEYFPRDVSPYQVRIRPTTPWMAANWISVVQWRDGAVVQLKTGPGIYIIEDAFNNLPIYVGQALNFRNRFKARTQTLHEYDIKVGHPVPWTVWTSSVVINPTNFAKKLNLAEKWLIRYTFMQDHKAPVAPPRPQLQNRKDFTSFRAPAGGLVVRFSQAGSPPYLDDPASPGYAINAAGMISYTYAAGAWVMP